MAPDCRPPDCRPPFYRSVWDCLVLSKIQECVFWKYKSPFKNKSLWNWFIIKEKRKSGFTPKTSIRLVNTIVNQFFYQKYRIEYSFVRSFWAWRFCKNLEEESSFKQKTWQYEAPEIKDSKVSVKYRRICKVIVTKDEDVKVSYKKTYKKTYK